MHRASDIEELKCWMNPPQMHIATVKKAVRAAWKRKFGDVCQGIEGKQCGIRMHFEVKFRSHRHYATIDHIDARGLGGGNELHNIQVICRECNNEKSRTEYLLAPNPS